MGTVLSTASSLQRRNNIMNRSKVSRLVLRFHGSSYNVSLTQTGNVISGSFTTTSGNVVTFTATLSSDSRTVTGTFTQSADVPGNFVWHLFNNLVQYNGQGTTASAAFEWCGYRAGQSAPMPCQAP
jgi:hypothetical protein